MNIYFTNYPVFSTPSTVHVFHVLYEALLLLSDSIVEVQNYENPFVMTVSRRMQHEVWRCCIFALYLFLITLSRFQFLEIFFSVLVISLKANFNETLLHISKNYHELGWWLLDMPKNLSWYCIVCMYSVYGTITCIYHLYCKWMKCFFKHE